MHPAPIHLRIMKSIYSYSQSLNIAIYPPCTVILHTFVHFYMYVCICSCVMQRLPFLEFRLVRFYVVECFKCFRTILWRMCSPHMVNVYTYIFDGFFRTFLCFQVKLVITCLCLQTFVSRTEDAYFALLCLDLHGHLGYMCLVAALVEHTHVWCIVSSN